MLYIGVKRKPIGYSNYSVDLALWAQIQVKWKRINSQGLSLIQAFESRKVGISVAGLPTNPEVPLHIHLNTVCVVCTRYKCTKTFLIFLALSQLTWGRHSEFGLSSRAVCLWQEFRHTGPPMRSRRSSSSSQR